MPPGFTLISSRSLLGCVSEGKRRFRRFQKAIVTRLYIITMILDYIDQSVPGPSGLIFFVKYTPNKMGVATRVTVRRPQRLYITS